VYRLKGASAPTRTNRLPLLTGFFATPVDRVELIEQGDGVDLAIDLREALDPHYEVIETPRGMVLQVDFPRGSSGPQQLGQGAGSPMRGRPPLWPLSAPQRAPPSGLRRRLDRLRGRGPRRPLPLPRSADYLRFSGRPPLPARGFDRPLPPDPALRRPFLCAP